MLGLRPDLFGQLAATDPYQGRSRRLFERGQVAAVSGNQADVLVGYDARGNALELKQVPIVSGYVPQVGDWVSIQYEAGHSAAPWVTGPSMAADEERDSAGIGVFSVSASEPADPQRSMVYFDESHATWRGWDGTEWVDFSAKLHNNLPDLQGGTAGAYYHVTQDEHGGVEDLCDGSGLASAWVKRLKLKAVDASGTSRGRLLEIDGDVFLTVNAEYDEVAGAWNRIDTSKYAYLIGIYSENGIPHEPGELGGVSWWRAMPGANPIGEWTSEGGWELGFMMTMHRNFVAGGMNFEIDGSGLPPYGRLSQSGSEDASGTVFTGVQRNSWYEGGGQWGRDSHDRNSAIVGFDAGADLFVWWYPDSSEGNAPWGTAAWQERARLHLGEDGIRGRLDVVRSSAETGIGNSAFLAKHRTSGDMGDGFGAGYAMAIEDSAGVENIVATMYGARAGADGTGKLSWHVASGGVLAERMSLTAAGVLAIDGGSMSFGGNALSVSAASAIDQDVRASGAPRFARVGLGCAADASAMMKADGQYYSDLHDNGNSGTSKTIDWNNGNVQRLTLTANCTLALSNSRSGGRYLLLLAQDATGNRVVTWPGTVKWPGGTAPPLSGGGKVDVISLVYDGGSYRCGVSLNY